MKLFLTIISVAYFALPIFSQQFNRWRGNANQQNCITPESYYGTCVTLSYCPQAVNIFQTTNRQRAEQYVFALQRSCGTRNINGDPVVCCTRPVTNIQSNVETNPNRNPVTPIENPFFPSEQTTRPTFIHPTASRETRNPQNPFLNMRKPQDTTKRPTVPTTTAPPVASAALIDSKTSYCFVPDKGDGVCIDIKGCPVLVNELYAKPNDATFANYLRALNVVCGGVGSIVCCPSGTQTTGTTQTAKQSQFTSANEIPRRPPTPQEGCGYSFSAFKKIVGGTVTKKGAWPWIALIGYDDDLSSSPFKCGGTLVTARHVVTAAHCIRSDLSFVRLGEHDLTTDTEAQHVDIPVVRNEYHPEYNRRNGRSDIAILYLERNIEFTDLISPVCLPTTPELRQKSYVSYTPFVAGWGKTMEQGESANILQELQIPILDNEVCRDRYQKQNRVFSADQFDSAVVCAGVTSGGKDTCQGDSGGPLMIPEPYENSVRYYLIGVVSYGIGCARPEVPGVYTSVQYFMDWILQKIADTN